MIAVAKHYDDWENRGTHVRWPANQKSNKVSPNARRRAQCKGGGGKKNIDTPETVQPTGVSQKTWWQHLHGTEIQETWKQSIPSDRISRNNFPIAHSLAPAKHFQFSVPSLLWASTGRMCWKWLPRKCSHPAFGG